MQITETRLKGVFLLEPRVFGDSRGWFSETFSKRELAEAGLFSDFVQDNHSFSAEKGTLRGLHFQNAPAAQTKLVRCTRGAVLDVAVDLRRGSPQYRRWVAVELTAENARQLYIPRGFGHGFLTLSADVEFQYKVDAYYSPAHDRGIRYDDPAIGVDWGPVLPVLSAKDRDAPLLSESDCNFDFIDPGPGPADSL
jgi:dTDP-4-dehydrorhamnose 3,5-epimerase